MARLPYPDIEHPDFSVMAERVRRERGGRVGNGRHDPRGRRKEPRCCRY